MASLKHYLQLGGKYVFAAVLGCIVLFLCFAANPAGSDKSEPTPPPAHETPSPTPEWPEQSAMPTPEPPEWTPSPDYASELIPEDPLAFLLGFADGEIVSLYDETSRSYENTGKSFAEIVSAKSWTAHAFPDTPASIAERLIIIVSGDWRLRIEDDGEDCLYMASLNGRGANDPVIYLDCGENLMDELMAWALVRQAQQQGRTPDGTVDDQFIEDGAYHDDMGSELIISHEAGKSFVVCFGVYKVAYFDKLICDYDQIAKVLHFTGTDVYGKAVSADVRMTGGRLTVTIVEWDYEDYLPDGTELVFYKTE